MGLNCGVQEPAVLRPAGMNWVEERGRRWAYFGGCDYLRLAWHGAIHEAVRTAVGELGVSAGASRMTTGNLPVYLELERALGRFFGVAGAVVTGSGYVAPTVAVQALAEEHTHVLLDERAHGCLLDAALVSGLPVGRYPHRSATGLREAARACGRRARVLVLTDGVWATSGEATPVGDYLEVLPKGGTVVVDDAHGAGVLGKRGRGTPEWAGLGPGEVVMTITLSKAFGCYGGAVLGSAELKERIRRTGRAFIGNTPVGPALAAAAVKAVEILRAEGRERRARLRAKVEQVRAGIRDAGGRAGEGPGPLVVRVPRGVADGRWLEGRLRAAGIHPPWIRYPQGPAERFFRFALSSEHEEAQVAALAAVLGEHERRGA